MNYSIFFRFYNVSQKNLESFASEILNLEISKKIKNYKIKNSFISSNMILPSNIEIKEVKFYFSTKEDEDEFGLKNSKFLPIYQKYTQMTSAKIELGNVIRKEPGDSAFQY